MSNAAHQTESRDARWRVAAAALLVVLTVAAYAPALNGEFLWDDDSYVESNPLVRDPGRFTDIWLQPRESPQYYPLVFSTFWVEHQLWGVTTFGFHAVNVLLHAGSAVLLWRLLARLEFRAAWFTAALFALHPVHVESVAWITERKNTLSGFFYLSAALSYLSARDGFATLGRFRRPPYVSSILLFLCALLSKTVTASLPAALLLVAWWKNGTLTRRDVLGVLPMILLALPLALFTVWLERTHVGATGADFDLSVVERVLIAGRVPWFYAAKLLVPLQLAFIYPRWPVDPAAWPQYLFPAGAVLVVVVLFRARKRLGRGPLTAVLFFGGTLLPVSGFLNVYPMKYSYVADHFQYLASIAILALAAGGLVWACERADRRRLQPALTVVVLCGLFVLTFLRCRVFSDPETLWRDALRTNPHSEMLHTNLGALLEDDGRLTEAFEHYQASVELAPDEAVPHFNFGTLLHRVGRTGEAIRHLERAIQLDPATAPAHMNLGAILMDFGAPEDALHHLERAVELDPEHLWAHYNLGLAYRRFGRPEDARRSFDAARRLVDPSVPPEELPPELRDE